MYPLRSYLVCVYRCLCLCYCCCFAELTGWFTDFCVLHCSGGRAEGLDPASICQQTGPEGSVECSAGSLWYLAMSNLVSGAAVNAVIVYVVIDFGGNGTF